MMSDDSVDPGQEICRVLCCKVVDARSLARSSEIDPTITQRVAA